MQNSKNSPGNSFENANNEVEPDQALPTQPAAPISIGKRFKSLFSDQSLTKKASLNAVATGLDYGARLLVGFLVTPLLVTGLGDYFYGAYQVLIRLIGYVTPASGRPTQALKMTLANQQLVATEDQKRQYVGSTLVIWVIFLPILSVVGGALTWFVPIWLKALPQTYGIIRFATAILVLNEILSSLSDVPYSVLQGENLGYKRMGLSAILVLLGGGFTWVAILLKTGLAGVAGAITLTTIVSGVCFLWVVKSYAPWFGAQKPNFSETKKFLALSVWFTLWNLVDTFIASSDVVVLGIFQSVQSVTQYTLTKYAPETSISIIWIIVFGILPGLGGIIGAGDLKKAAKIRGEIMSFTWWVLTVLGTTTLIWNSSFLKLWVGNQHYSGSIVNLLITLMMCQYVIMRNDASVIDLTLKLPRKVILGIISISVSVAASIIFVGPMKFGIIGLCLGVMLGRMVLTIAYPLIVGRHLQISAISQAIGAIRPGLVTIALFSIACFFSETIDQFQSFFTNNWIGLGLIVCFTMIVLLVLSYYLGFNQKQKENLNRRIKAIFSQNAD